MAFVPINGDYHEESVESVGVFDENQNIDTAPPGSWLGGPLADRQSLYDWATQSVDDILIMKDCDSEVGDCLLPATRDAMMSWREQINAAGTDPINHPNGESIAKWIGFAQPFADRPQTDQRPAHFDDDNRFKIRLKAIVSFVTGPDGR